MALNKNYGRASQNQIQYAPRTFKENNIVVVPKIDDDQAYLSRNWFKVTERKPEYDPDNYKLQQTGWDEDAETHEVFATYETVEIQPAPRYIQVRRFSKLRLVEFCMEQGIWTDLKAFLESTGYYDLFVMAMVFLENDKFFKRGLLMYKVKKIEDGADPNQIQKTINMALDFAFDSYETVEVKDNEQQMEEQQ